jgi:hypothetical protein
MLSTASIPVLRPLTTLPPCLIQLVTRTRDETHNLHYGSSLSTDYP